MLEQSGHVVDRVADELGHDPHRLYDLVDLVQPKPRLPKLCSHRLDLKRDALSRIRACCPQRATEVGVLPLEFAHMRPRVLCRGLTFGAPDPDVLVDDLDHLSDGIWGDERAANEVHHAVLELVGADVRPAAFRGAAVVAVGPGVGARHPGAAGAAQELRQRVAARAALRRQPVSAALDGATREKITQENTGWVLETEQYGTLWRTDQPASDIRLVRTDQSLAGPASAVAVAVSVTGDASPAAMRYLAASGDPVSRLIHISVEHPSNRAITGGGDLTAIAASVRNSILTLDERPTDVSLLYWGPATGAVFIGHALNGVAPRIHLHEEEFGAYTPSITLS